MGNYHLEDEVWDEAWNSNQKGKVNEQRIDILNEQYRRACKQEMMNDLIKKFNLFLFDENISDDSKDKIYRIVMDVLSLNS